MAGAHDFTDDNLPHLLRLYESRGWQPPPLARREGGLWLLSKETIAALHRASNALGKPYGTSCFDALFTQNGTERSLPVVDCTRSHGGVLPPRALELVRAGMCCILEKARLWPAAEDSWGRVEYLRQELKGCACAVLSSPATSRRFSYWFDSSSYSDRVHAGYKASPLVSSINMSIDQYLEAQPEQLQRSPQQRRCLYLQQSILQSPPASAAQGQPGLIPCAGLGAGMQRDIASGIDMNALKALAQAGGFGPWQRCQLFVGGASAEGARSILHFDQYDNLFIQISGSKRFRFYEPQQTQSVYPYPIHHPLDTRAQVDLEQPDYAAFPKLRGARSVEIVLHPGQMLFLPCYWWHEVLTEPATQRGELCVSVNFWFAASNRILQPSLPLVPSMQCELARQLEYLVSDCLSDRARHVPAFLKGMVAALEVAHSRVQDAKAADAQAVGAQAAPAAVDAAVSTALHACRPSDVRPDEWQGVFEFVLWKLSLLIGAEHLLAFTRDLLDPARFAMLRVVR